MARIGGMERRVPDNHVTFWRLAPKPTPYLLRRRGDETNRIEFKNHWMATGSRFEGFGLLWDLTMLDNAVKISGDNREHANQIIDRLIAPVTLATNERGLSRVSFLPAGNAVITLDMAQRLRLVELEAVGGGQKVWQIKPGRPKLLRGHEQRITLLHIHRQTGLVLTTAENESARVWDLRPPAAGNLSQLAVEQLLIRAGRAAGRNMTPAEWKLYLPQRQYTKTFAELP
jgi:hypothetical protein